MGTGKPTYDIVRDGAWDFIRFTPDLRELAATADAVCFGSLAQRSEVSRQTILAFLRATPPDAVRLFDINLRQNFYDKTIARQSLELANVMKLNDEELPVVLELLGLETGEDPDAACCLLSTFDLDLLVVTRGGDGSWLFSRNDWHAEPGQPITIADTVGAGDAFTGALCHIYLQNHGLATISQRANRMGAWVASCHGATPPANESILATIR